MFPLRLSWSISSLAFSPIEVRQIKYLNNIVEQDHRAVQRVTKPMMDGNVVMLGAILQRQIMDRVEAGMPLEKAVTDVADWHRQTVAEQSPPLAH